MERKRQRSRGHSSVEEGELSHEMQRVPIGETNDERERRTQRRDYRDVKDSDRHYKNHRKSSHYGRRRHSSESSSQEGRHQSRRHRERDNNNGSRVEQQHRERRSKRNSADENGERRRQHRRHRRRIASSSSSLSSSSMQSRGDHRRRHRHHRRQHEHPAGRGGDQAGRQSQNDHQSTRKGAKPGNSNHLDNKSALPIAQANVDDGDDDMLLEYGDEEAQLRHEEEERQKLMEAIRLKHNKAPVALSDAVNDKTSEEKKNGAEDVAPAQKENAVDAVKAVVIDPSIETTGALTTCPPTEAAAKGDPPVEQADLELDKKQSAQKDILDLEREAYYNRLADQEEVQETTTQAKPAEKKKKTFDLFAESSDSQEESEGDQDNVVKTGFTVANPSVDDQGYYQPKTGEIIGSRYRIMDNAGKGVFSCVVKATEIASNKVVAIKIMRTKFEVMRQSGLKERDIISRLNQSDPNDRKHCIRLLDSFEYSSHLCLVYELMGLNLRETLNKFGRNIGLSLDGVVLYGRQLFIALSLLHRNKLIHADLKPDNIMVSEDTRRIKLCDFGSCLTPQEIRETETDHLVSPFYRAPEVILGCTPFDPAVDIWAAGCTLFELFTGKFMFPGRSNNHLLKLHMEAKGKISSKLIRRGKFSDKHFNLDSNQFLLEDVNMSQQMQTLLQGQFSVKTVPIPQVPTRPLFNRLRETFGIEKTDAQDLALFADFLEKCTQIDPQRRITADDALNHPFLNILRLRQQSTL